MDDTASLQRRLLDLLVMQCHGKSQQYVDDKDLMIHHTVAAAIQLDISPLTGGVDPDTLTGPARKIAQDCFATLLT